MVPEVPPALEDIIQRALNLNVNQRPQSIAEIAPALSGLESVTASTTDRAPKTVAIADFTQPHPGAGTSKPPSIKVPSLRASQAVVQPGTEALPGERSGVKPGVWLAIVGIPAALVAVAAGVYLYRPVASPPPPAVPEIAKPLPTPSPTAPEAKPPAETTAAVRPENPQPPKTPTPAAPPASTAGSQPAALPGAGKPANLMNEFEKLRQGKSTTDGAPMQPPVANIEPLPSPGTGATPTPNVSKPPRRIVKPPPVARTAPPKPPRSPPRRSNPSEPPPKFEFQVGPTVKTY
jgi:hypothetical protein